MSKITRRSYKRKKIVMGLALFGAIGLVSTGFAAWVLSARATNDQNPQINVGTVKKNNLEFANIEIKGEDTTRGSSTLGQLVATDHFSFNPRLDDENGRVRFGVDGEDKEGERMTLTISGIVKEAQNLGTLSVTPGATVDPKLTAAVDAGYIVLPDCLKGDGITLVENTDYTISTVDDVTTASFHFDVELEWGDFFGGVNPADYYDNDPAGKLVSIDDVYAQLDALHTELDAAKVNLTIVAEPK